MTGQKTAAQSSVAYGSYAVADDSAVIVPDAYISIFDQLWILGIDGNDWVRIGGVVVLALTCLNLIVGIRKNIRDVAK